MDCAAASRAIDAEADSRAAIPETFLLRADEVIE
jgi:hypothetical protein